MQPMKERLYFMERERDLWMKQCLEAETRVAELEAQNATLRDHRCEVGLENPDAFLAHLRSMNPEESEALRNAVNPRY